MLSLYEAHVGVCARINDFLQYPIETNRDKKASVEDVEHLELCDVVGTSYSWPLSDTA